MAARPATSDADSEERSATPSQTSPRRFTTLDGLRGVAALAVVQYHASAFFGFQFPSSYLAVDLFFILSGIVIAHSYDGKLASGMSVRGFTAARLVRLYPLYLVATAAGLAFVVANALAGNADVGPAELGLSLVLSLMFLPTPGGLLGSEDLFPLVHPAWSLFFELSVNLVYAVIFPLLSLRVLTALALSGAGLLVLTTFWFDGLNAGSHWGSFGGGIARVTFGFFTGVLLARFPLRMRGSATPALLSLAVMVLSFALPVSQAARPFHDLAVVLAVYPLVAAVAAASEAGPRTRSVFEYLGRLSYGIYVLHVPVIFWAMGIAPRITGVQLAELGPVAGVAVIATVCVLADLVDRLFDAPVRRRLGGWLGRGQRQAEAGSGEVAGGLTVAGVVPATVARPE